MKSQIYLLYRIFYIDPEITLVTTDIISNDNIGTNPINYIMFHIYYSFIFLQTLNQKLPHLEVFITFLTTTKVSMNAAATEFPDFITELNTSSRNEINNRMKNDKRLMDQLYGGWHRIERNLPYFLPLIYYLLFMICCE